MADSEPLDQPRVADHERLGQLGVDLTEGANVSQQFGHLLGGAAEAALAPHPEEGDAAGELVDRLP